MITLDKLREALRQPQPWTAMDELVRAEQAAGRKVQEIHDELRALVEPVRALDNPPEDADDAMMDTLDALAGNVARDWQYTDPPNSISADRGQGRAAGRSRIPRGPAVVAAEVIEAVRRELAAVEITEDVKVLYAVESGSRAWGFASADSDYDVRLVYVHRPAWYLSIDLEEKRDVIERQLPGDIDLSGWDLRKALRLFAKSNPPLVEWLDSSVIYHESGGLADRLRELLRPFYSPAAALHHYLRMAQNNWHAYCRGDRVRLKKYLYVLRPLLSARWIEQDRGPVPMLFRRLFVTIADRPELLAEIEALLVRKMAGGELGEGSRIGPIHGFAAAELERLPAVAAGLTKTSPGVAPLDELFRETLNDVW